MAKSFKKFREEWEDEWGHDDQRGRGKKDKMEKRKARQKEKYESRWEGDDSYRDKKRNK